MSIEKQNSIRTSEKPPIITPSIQNILYAGLPYEQDSEFHDLVKKGMGSHAVLRALYDGGRLSGEQFDRAAARLEATVIYHAGIDPLTSIRNRKGFTETATNVLRRSEINEEPAAVFVIDSDDFKKVNDTPGQGHEVGDVVLREIATVLKETTRPEDVIGRWGGDEFVVCVPNVTKNQARDVAERIRTTTCQGNPETNTKNVTERVREQGKPLAQQVTISIGVAMTSKGYYDLTKLLSQADRSLFEAKRHQEGKNRTVISRNKRRINNRT
jgi:diguanylate cyclase (GGDEF)-like protein